MGNQEQLKGIVRQILLIISGILAASGFKNSETIAGILTSEAMIGLVLAIVTSAWSWISRSNDNLVIAAAKTDNVQQVTVNNKELATKVAEAAPDTKVVVKP